MYRVITNNPLAMAKGAASERYNMVWREGGAPVVLTAARDLVHLGWRLVNHPLASSIKPNQTPYKTLVLARGSHLDLPSLRAIEGALAAARKLGPFLDGDPRVLADLQIIDWEMCRETWRQIQRGERV